MRRLFAFSAFLFISLLSPAQTSRLLNTKDGLCSTSLRALTIDSDGNLWIGTQGGLNRYDGFSVSSYYHNPGKTSSLTNDVIQVLVEDDKRNLLIGTLNGICVYSLDDRIFHEVVFTGGEAPNVSSILVRHDGSVLASTLGHAGVYRIEKNENGDFMASPLKWSEEPHKDVSGIFEDSSGNVWIWTDNDGVFTLAPDGTSTRVKGISENNERARISSICEDSFGTIYIAGRNIGILTRNKGEIGFTQLLPEQLSRYMITRLKYHKGHIYICTQSDGILAYSLESGELEPYEVNPKESGQNPGRIYDMLFDQSDNLLLALDHKGVQIYYSENDFLTEIGLGEDSETGSAGATTYLSVNGKGQTWVSTEDDGAYLLDSHFNILKHILPGTSITSIFEDRDGVVWINIARQGLFRILPGQKGLEHYPLYDSEGNEVRMINDIVADMRNNLWISGFGTGVFTVNPERTQNRLLPWSQGKSNSDGLCNKWPNCLELDRDRLYVGTYNGLACYDFRAGSFLGTFKDSNHMFDDLMISDIEVDVNRNLWLATTTGLIFFNTETQESTQYTYSDGLPQNNILAVESDANNHIWISTPSGLACFTPENSQITRILSSQSENNEYCKNVSVKMKDEGIVMFGSLDGLSWFNPNRMTYAPALSEIKVAGVHIGETFRPVEKFRHGNISLKHSENVFSVELTTGDYSENSHASFLYGIDDGGYEPLPHGINIITFNKMKAGKHILKVRCNSPGRKYEELEFGINIHAPWYASYLAMVIYFLLVSMIAVLSNIFQLAKFQKREEEQKNMHELKMNETKLEYFFNLAHEIRMPMSLIISPLDKLIATDGEASRQIQYKMMENNARRITLLINQIMDIRKIEKGKMSLLFSKTDINHYIRPLIEVMNQNALLKSITLTFSPSDKEAEVWIDLNQFDKIVLNLVQNAIKYTPEGGNVQVNLDTDEKNLILTVRDNGTGIDEDKLEKIFERFYQCNGDYSPNMGVGIGLNLVQSLVAMHHGTVRAFNNVNAPGATFEVRIPLGREHLQDSEISIRSDSDRQIKSAAELFGTLGDRAANREEANKSKMRSTLAVVEDSAEIRQYLINELSEDYNVTAYEDGEAALKGILKSSPDVIISDVIMPKMDGFQLCEKLKRNINTNAIPIILLTGKTDEIDKITGMDVGADAYITKPFNIIFLKKNIEQLLDSVNRLKNIYIGRQEAKIEKVPDIKDPDEQLMERINKVLNDNLSNPELNVDFLAREACLSRVHLYRKLTELTNQGPGEYIRNARLKMAAELLKEKHLGVSTVAAETGFSSISVFSRAFKQLYGMSPSDYLSKNS